MTSSSELRYISSRNPVQRVRRDLLSRLIDAQNNTLERRFANAAELFATVFDQLKLALPVPAGLQELAPQSAADRSVPELERDFLFILETAGIVGSSARVHAMNLAHRTHLVRAFEDPDSVLAGVVSKVERIVKTFPQKAADIERGRNPGDVLDPYILTATQTLLHAGSFQDAIGATVSHKALMIIEGLMGHLHEDVVGEMRGNVRAPEPRGFNQEMIDPHDNPFPGADIVQPPTRATGTIRFHQVKSKTGSAKGGDGRRLGEQLRRLREYYDAEVYYDALIGNTLRGHRSMRGVLASEPEAVILVGDAAFRELTGSTIGPQLLLRVYQGAFAEAARLTGYRIDTMAATIVSAFRERLATAGESYLELLLGQSISSNPDEQDSRVFEPPSRRKRSR